MKTREDVVREAQQRKSSLGFLGRIFDDEFGIGQPRACDLCSGQYGGYNVGTVCKASCPNSREYNLLRHRLRELYRTSQANPELGKKINWARFSKMAEQCGLHYSPDAGLMTTDAWLCIESLFNAEE